MIKTLTVRELTALLLAFTKEDDAVGDYKVFLSTDPEGNGFSTLDPKDSFQWIEQDKALLMMPYQDGLSEEEIAPIWSEEISEIIRRELGR